jgi:hypothetical protein
MLLVPVFAARRRMRAIVDKSDRALVAGTCLIIGLVSVDLIPNGLWADYPYLLAGALMGATRAMMAQKSKQQPSGALTREGVAAAAAL